VTPDEVLARIREYRAATRRAVEADDHRVQDRYLALIDLATAARAEADPLVRLWSERAIWQEARGFVGMDDEPREVPGEGYERAQRRLRSIGFAACPECRSLLVTEEELDRWARLRLRDAEERDRRAAVVP
jgi:hypothetical protein